MAGKVRQTSLRATAVDPFRGSRIGKYEVLTQLSTGGMAELFLAVGDGPGGFRKYVVVKRILPDARSDEHSVRMFLDEARVTALFSHPNIAQVFDLGEDPDGLYLAMEFIAGQNVNQVVNGCAQRREPLPIGFSAAVVRDVCLALHYAHTFMDPLGRPSPVIHRDVAQKNVMVTYEGAVKLLDFGIAKARRTLERTRAGMVKGTTGYMSPEQVLGEPLDGRSDVFGAGVVLHELIAGQRLFAAGSEREEMRKVLEHAVPRPSELRPVIPRELSEAVMRALARERADRFQTAKDLARAIERAAGPLLFDQDARASFMRELFEQRMEATRAVLEAAEQEGDPSRLDRAVRALRRDLGHAFPDGTLETAGGAAGSSAEAERDRIALDAEAQSLADRRSGGPGTYRAVGLAALLACVVLAALYGALLPFRRLGVSPEDDSGQKLPRRPEPKFTGTLPPLPDFDGPARTPPGGPVGNGSAPAPVADPARPEPPAAAPGDLPGRHDGPAPRSRRAGTLTLVTTPDCEVRSGRRTLGRTPLFDLPLPAGTHVLVLRDGKGRERILSVPVRSGERTSFRLKLAELPER